MYFRMLHDPASGELSYLLADLDAAEAVLIDPRGRDLAVLRALLAEHGLRLRWILRTHHHDAAQPAERDLLMQLHAPIVQGEAGEGVHAVADGDILPFGNELVRVLATPGHTANDRSYAWRDRLFCGGTLAVQDCPHQPLPAAPQALWDTVTQRIFTLPDETLLFAAHARQHRAVSTVLEERRAHPWFAGTSRDDFLARAAVPAGRDLLLSSATP